MDSIKDVFTGIILAGGLGTRVREFYPDLPKPMIPFHNKAFLEWIILFLEKQGLHRFIVSSGYRAEKIESYFSSWRGVQVCTEPRPLGTAGGALFALSHSLFQSEYVVLCNGDSLLLIDLENILKEVVQKKSEFVLVGTPVNDVSRFGSLKVDYENHLLGFNEKGGDGPGIINSGIYVIKTNLLKNWATLRFNHDEGSKSDLISASIELDLIPDLIKRNKKIQVRIEAGDFIDIGTPSTLTMAEDFIKNHREHFQL